MGTLAVTPHNLLGLIWVQTVCKSFQMVTKDATSREKVKEKMDQNFRKLTIYIFSREQLVLNIKSLFFTSQSFLVFHPGFCNSKNRRSYMSAHVLFNLLNKLRKRDKMRGLPSILSLFCDEFDKFNNTWVELLYSFCHITSKLTKNAFLAWKCQDFDTFYTPL